MSDLVDIKMQPKKNTQGGRPRSAFLDKLLKPCYRRQNPSKTVWRCAGNQCGYTFASRNVRRVTRHCKDCRKLTSELRSLAAANAIQRAPSNILAEEDAKVSAKSQVSVKNEAIGEGHVAKKIAREGGQDGSPVTDISFFGDAKMKGRKQRNARTDFEMVKLFCVGGLSTNLSTRAEWKSMLNSLDPKYPVPSRERIESEMIPGEQEVVKDKQRELLRAEPGNLTISFDGGTTEGREAFWTVNVSTPDGKVYLMEGREATDVSHTGAWIADLAMEVSGYI